MPSRSHPRELGLAAVQVLMVFLGLVVAAGWVTRFGADSHAYWNAWRHDHLYTATPGQVDAYLYSPAFAEMLRPLTWLPWPVFAALWSSALAAIFWWLLLPVRVEWRIPLFVLCLPEIVIGNVYALFAAVLVLGFRRPALWAFPVLTKIAPGVGWVWFAVRREWRALAVAVGTTTLVVVISVAAAPSLWAQWVHFLTDNRGYAGESSHLLGVVRIPMAVAVAAVAARTNRAWLLAVALVLSSPVLASFTPLTALTAIPRLRRRDGIPETAPGAVPPMTALRPAGM